MQTLRPIPEPVAKAGAKILGWLGGLDIRSFIIGGLVFLGIGLAFRYFFMQTTLVSVEQELEKMREAEGDLGRTDRDPNQRR